MSTRVVTISTCDRCGAVHEGVGPRLAHDKGWRRIEIGHAEDLDMLLCPACVADVRRVLEDKPGARVPPVRQEEAPGETGQMSREGVE